MPSKTVAIAGIFILIILVGGYFLLNKNSSVQKVSNIDKETEEKTTVPEAVSIVLNGQNNSGEAGIATFKEVDGKVEVTIKLTGNQGTSQPTHLHSGTCDSVGAVVFPLENIINGESITLLNIDMAGLVQKYPLILNVHKSPEEPLVYTSCGPLVSS